ncbi:glucose PTS transporter subunit IIA [Bifidobacterium gallicum]|uniref:PTS mannose transporter subunit IIABC n=1 Tax=Bifidobacterium gallicum DSM 20093 = LMG 11596 TaxID=561180 RepID=D1NV91_9BIFI|nr:glucose PTS transporter subunit IIA [Bifidobacterium gallicum]EFA22742.1 phosphotransferase system, EIIC [Bifidobacterium gallicum DSM 20093 = LMG 11596]KFI59687.1 PTS mannose transporter subunit IIABC [Bifidobacterium gallicum DSM 20093 = LMG 11596]
MAQSTAAQIIDAVGGAGNVKSLTHCATRLRFELVDANKVDQSALEHMKGVLGAVPQSGDRYQVVIGGGVANVYNDIMQLPQMQDLGSATAAKSADSGDGTFGNTEGLSDAEVKAQARAKTKKPAWIDSFFEYLSDSFRPILGVLLGASLIIAILNVCIACGWIQSETDSPTTVFIQALYKGVFYFLPIMIAYNASKKLKVDPWVGAAIMGALMTPSFMSLLSTNWADTVCHKVMGNTQCMTRVFNIPMQLNDYSGNVFVPLLMAAVLALVYRGLKSVIPDSVQLVFVPFLSMIIVGALTAFLIGPIGIWVGNGLGVGLSWLNTHAPFIFAILIPMIYPFLVPLGLHWPLNALMLANIQTLGYDFIQGPMGTWNFACFGATAGVLVLSLRDHDAEMRQTAGGALAAGLLGGVSEPSLYGTHLRFKLIYRRMLIGCAAGGVTIAVLGWLFPSTTDTGEVVRGVTTSAFAFASLLTIPVFNQMWVYAISIAVAFVVSMLLIIFFDYRTPEQKAEVLARVAAARAEQANETDANRAAVEYAETHEDDNLLPGDKPVDAPVMDVTGANPAVTSAVYSPMNGHVIALADCGDPVFASGALGSGVAIEPRDAEVVAPVAGVLQTVAETGHAFGVKTDDGVEILVHVGIDTVKMEGKGFNVHVKEGQRVNVGEDPLVTVDFNAVAEAGYSTTTLMTVLNTAALASVDPIAEQDVTAGEQVITIKH